jgi:hypothetical protein
MGQLAKVALKEYGMHQTKLKFYMQAVNTLYRVYDTHQEST